MRGIYYGWLIVAAGMVFQALNALLLNRSFGTYVVFLQNDFGWSKTTFSGAYALQQVESGLLGPLQGWMVDRFGPRAVMRVGNVMFGAGLMLFSRMDSVLTFYLAFVIIAVGTSLGGMMPLAVTIVNWFARKRATAMGIMQTGMNIGGLLAPALVWVMVTYGWRHTAFISGVVVMVIGLPLTQLIRHAPEPYGYLPDGDKPEDRPLNLGAGTSKAARVTTAEPAFTPREAMRTSAFWLVSLGHAAALLVVTPVQVHLVPFLNESLGYSPQKGSFVFALVTVSSMVAQVFGGLLSDRLNRRVVVISCMIGHAVAFLALASATNMALVVFFALVHGTAWGMRGPLMTAIRADYFGRASFGSIMGFSSMIVTAGSILGPLLAGVMADHFGSYRIGFAVLAIGAGLGSFFWVLARPPRAPGDGASRRAQPEAHGTDGAGARAAHPGH